MRPTVTVQEFVIVIAAKNNNPTLLTPDFLKYTGIVPADWELARSPIANNRVAQITFQNGISIVAETNRVIFLETVHSKDNKSLLIPQIARKYVETLPNVEYQGIGLNPRGYVSFDMQDAARQYFTNTLFSKDSWHEIGDAPVRATANFTYTLERGQFNLSVNEASLRLPNEKPMPVVLFTGNFSYEVANDNVSERLLRLYQAIENWQADLESYCDIVNTKFLSSSNLNTVVSEPELASSVSAISNADLSNDALVMSASAA